MVRVSGLASFPRRWLSCVPSTIWRLPLLQSVFLARVVLFYFWALCSILLIFYLLLIPVPCWFCYYGSVVLLKSGKTIPPGLFLPGIVLAIYDILCFQMNFRIVFSSFVKNVIGVFTAISLNLQDHCYKFDHF